MAIWEVRGRRLPVKILSVDTINGVTQVALESGKKLWVDIKGIR